MGWKMGYKTILPNLNYGFNAIPIQNKKHLGKLHSDLKIYIKCEGPRIGKQSFGSKKLRDLLNIKTYKTIGIQTEQN